MPNHYMRSTECAFYRRLGCLDCLGCDFYSRIGECEAEKLGWGGYGMRQLLMQAEWTRERKAEIAAEEAAKK